MYTRNKAVGAGPGASPAPRPARELGRPPASGQGAEAAPGAPSADGPGRAGPRHMGAYTVIIPNETRRNQLQRIAEKEMEDLEKWKEQHRAKPVNLVPRRLGGSQSEAEVRRKQQLQQMQSKYQQKLKREEAMRIKKEAEEAEIQKMKAIQREKSNKLEEKKRLEENLRREAYRHHQQHKTAEFLSRLETDLPHRRTCQIAPRDPQPSTWRLPALPRDPSWARSQAYRDSLREEENRKLQKMKEEQHQKVFIRPSLLVIANYLLVVLDNFERFLNGNIYMHENPEKVTQTLKIEGELQVCFKSMVVADSGGNAHSTLPQRGLQRVCCRQLTEMLEHL